MKYYEIRDPIYGFITLNEWEREIINHSAFQRLRRIRQLALTEMVYPGATHSRFEHSLGVMHLATLMYDSILKKDGNRKILEEKLHYNEAGFKRDRQLIRLACLLHDIGQPPFSHASEDILPINPKTQKAYKHEFYSSLIVKQELKDVIETHPINTQNYNITAEEVSALIEGNVDVLGERIFWKVLISSQLDADRGDYLLRDSHHIGVRYGVYDYWRLINTTSLGIDPESKDVILGVDYDGWHVAESLVIARYQMFTQVYFHKTRRAYDYHLRMALSKILPNNKLPEPEKIKEFLTLDDHLIYSKIYEHIDDEDCRAIVERNHIRMVYSTSETPDKREENIKEEKKKLLKNNKIWFFEDRATSLWYKINSDETDNKEILIIKDKKAYPLSKESSIVKNMKEIKQIRLYVKPRDKDKAKEVLQ